MTPKPMREHLWPADTYGRLAILCGAGGLGGFIAVWITTPL